jgi:hypothetical protein
VALFDLIEAQHNRGDSANPHTMTFSSTIPTGSLLLVWTHNNSADATRYVDDNKGNTYTIISGGDSFWGDFYYCTNVVGGAGFAVSNHNPSAVAEQMCIVALEGDGTISLDGVLALQYNGGGSTSYDFGDCTTTVAGDLLVGSIAAHDADPAIHLTDTTGFSVLVAGLAGDYLSSIVLQQKLAGAAGNYRMTGFCSLPGQMLGQVISFKTVSAGLPTASLSLGGFTPATNWRINMPDES